MAISKTEQNAISKMKSGCVITRFLDAYYLTKQGESTPIREKTVLSMLSQKLIKRTNYTTLFLS